MNNKRVGIITFHNSYNCGSMLESYAIHKYLLKKGIDNEIINFSNKGQKEFYSTFEKNNSLKRVIKNLIIFPYRKKININNARYENFKNKNFILSNNEFINGKDIPDDYDIVIAGSDQIWNIGLTQGVHPAYFLMFSSPEQKLISYAPSMALTSIPEAYKRDLKNALV